MRRGAVQVAARTWRPAVRSEMAMQIPNLNLKKARISVSSMMIGTLVSELHPSQGYLISEVVSGSPKFAQV